MTTDAGTNGISLKPGSSYTLNDDIDISEGVLPAPIVKESKKKLRNQEKSFQFLDCTKTLKEILQNNKFGKALRRKLKKQKKQMVQLNDLQKRLLLYNLVGNQTYKLPDTVPMDGRENFKQFHLRFGPAGLERLIGIFDFILSEVFNVKENSVEVRTFSFKAAEVFPRYEKLFQVENDEIVKLHSQFFGEEKFAKLVVAAMEAEEVMRTQSVMNAHAMQLHLKGKKTVGSMEIKEGDGSDQEEFVCVATKVKPKAIVGIGRHLLRTGLFEDGFEDRSKLRWYA